MSAAPLPLLSFERPSSLQASTPPEDRGLARDEVRLLVSRREGHSHSRFRDLAEHLHPGDVLVVNRSATVAASLPARFDGLAFTLNLCTRYGQFLWLAELRRSPADPTPIRPEVGERIAAGGSSATVLAPYPGIPRLRFVRFDDDPQEAMRLWGTPIRYAYLDSGRVPGLADYQTVFADRPGSAEMPSAGRPFTPQLLERLERRGVLVERVTLHTGVSSLEMGDLEEGSLYPEPFEVDAATAARLDRARAEGRRVIAVGTTVVRALCSVWDGRSYRAARGFTRLFVRPGHYQGAVDGLITGFHDPAASHLAMLEAVAGRRLIEEGYREAVREGYLWHEFGDSHLLLP